MLAAFFVSGLLVAFTGWYQVRQTQARQLAMAVELVNDGPVTIVLEL